MTKEEYTLRRAEVDRQIDRLMAEKEALDQEYALTLTDIRVGDKIEYGYKTRMFGFVDRIELRYGRLGFSVRRIKKDGSVSDFITSVDSWHDPKKIEQ